LVKNKSKHRYDLNDAIEIGIVMLSFTFATIFLLRIGENAGSAIQFQAQNGINLFVASILTVAVLGLFLGRNDCVITIGSIGPYIACGLTTGVASYLLSMFDLSPEQGWLCLVVGFSALAALTLASWKEKVPGSFVFSGGMWAVMVVSSAAGMNLISSQEVLGLLVLVALAGTFIGVLGMFEVLDHCRSGLDRFGYSAAAFSLLMVWLSSSRSAVTGITDGYSSLDWVMAISSVMFGLLGASVLAQRRFMDAQTRKALAEGHDAYQSADYDKAVQSYDRALIVRPQSKIARTCKADALAQNKKYDEAIKLYDSVLKQDKEYIPAISGKGSTLRQKGEFAKSVIYLQRALNIDPDSKIAWNNKGNSFFFLDEIKTAIYCYKKAIELDPSYSGAWYNLGVAYTNTGDFLEADYTFRTASNLIEGKRTKESRLLSRSSAKGAQKGTARSSGGNLWEDRPRGASFEMLIGDTEKRVLSHIAFSPGASLPDVVDAVTIGEGQAKAVLGELVRSGMVEVRLDVTRKRYYPKEQLPVMIEVHEMEEGTVRERKVRYLSDFQKRLVQEVETSPGLSAKELSEKLGVSGQVLDFHLEVLTRGGVLVAKRKGPSKRFYQS